MGKNFPQVLIGAIIFNEENNISRSILSLLEQNYTDLEIVVFDNCSTDNSIQLLNSFKDSRIVVFSNDKNIGPWGNYLRMVNYITQREDYKYFLWADIGDFYHKNYIKSLVNLMEKSPKSVVALPSVTIKWVNENKLCLRDEDVSYGILDANKGNFFKAFHIINDVFLQFCMVIRGLVRREYIATIFGKTHNYFALEEWCGVLAFYLGGIVTFPCVLHEKIQSTQSLEVRLPGMAEIYDLTSWKKRIKIFSEQFSYVARINRLRISAKLQLIFLLFYRLFMRGLFIKILQVVVPWKILRQIKKVLLCKKFS